MGCVRCNIHQVRYKEDKMITIKFEDYPDFPCQDCVERDECPKTSCANMRKWKEKHRESLDKHSVRTD